MAKDPAFLFYPGDWLGGTMLLTRHQKGCYLDLLMAQFNSGPLSLDHIKTVLGQDQAMWTVLQEKFTRDNSGRFFNKKLATEIEKRKAYVDSLGKRNQGRKKSSDKSSEIHMNIHMDNENENENRIEFLKGGVGENKRLEILESQIWIESIAMQKRISGPDVTQYLENFLTDLILKEDFGKPVGEIKKHFISWLNIQLAKPGPKISKIEQTLSEIQTGKEKRAEFFKK